MMAGDLRLLTCVALVAVFAKPSATSFHVSRFSPGKGRHPGSSPAREPPYGVEVKQPSDCCECANPHEIETIVLNCDKAVTEYTEDAPIQDEPALWEELDTRLEIEQCHPYQQKKGCGSMKLDSPFQNIVSYVANHCINGISNADYLRDLVLSYCAYHSADEAVERAFECTTGCGIADHINQVCRNLLGCPMPFDLSGGSCFSARMATSVADFFTFSKATAACEAIGGQLPRIDSPQENAAVQALVPEDGFVAFIGLNDMAMEGNFVWAGSEGSPPTYYDWFMTTDGIVPSNNDGFRDCVIIYWDDGTWDPTGCDATRSSLVCETSPILVLPSP